MRLSLVLTSLAILAVFCLLPATTNATIIIVPGDSATIQGAIDGAASGDTIDVSPGTYFEHIVIDGKSVHLRSSGGSAVTTIDAERGYSVVRVTATGTANSVVEGFTLTGGNPYTLNYSVGHARTLDCVIDIAQEYPVYTHPQWASAVETSNSFLTRSDQIKNAVMIKSGNITADETWPTLPYPFCYYLPGGNDVKLYSSSAVWTIEPNTVVKSSVGATLKIDYGRFMADSVVFTSAADDTLGAVDGDWLSVGAPGQWNYLRFYNNANDASVVSNCVFRYAGNSALYIDNAVPTVTGCVFTQNGEYPLNITNQNGGDQVRSNQFVNNQRYPAILHPGSVEGVVNNNYFEPRPSGDYNAFVIRSGNITATTTWPTPPSPFCYYLPDGNDVKLYSSSAVWTIEPNTVVKSSVGATLKIDYGRFMADSVVFTSAADDTLGAVDGDWLSVGAPGQWNYLRFYNNANDASVVSNCVFRYAGNSALYIDNAVPTVTGCVFTQNGEYPLNITNQNGGDQVRSNQFVNNQRYPAILHPGSVDSIVTNNTFEPHPSGEYNAFVIRPGNITDTTTWPTPPYPFCYYLPSGYDVTLYSSSAVWTIAPNTVVKSTAGARLIVDYGRFMADSVVFTSADDDTLGAVDGDWSSVGAPGQWQCIFFDANANDASVVSNCLFRYGGAWPGCVVYAKSASPSLLANTFTSNLGGIYCNDATPVITDCSFIDNTDWGVRNVSTGVSVDARNNWWGDNSGPYDTSSLVGEIGPGCDPNPFGLGDQVSDYVLYCPWTVKDTTIDVSPASLLFATTENTGTPDPQTLHISSIWPDGTLNWTLTEDCDWLTVDKTTGSNPDDVVVSIVDAFYPAGIYSTYLTFVDPEASNSPKEVLVTLFVESGVDLPEVFAPPGTMVSVPINIATTKPLLGYTIPLVYRTDQPGSVHLDSVVINDELDAEWQLVDDSIIIVDRPRQEPPLPDSGIFELGRLYFTVAENAVSEVVVIDTTRLLDYSYRFIYDPGDPGDTVVPAFDKGALVIGLCTDLPIITVLEQPYIVDQPVPSQVCVNLPVANADVVTATGGATWSAGQLCFQADTTGFYRIDVTAEDSCGVDYERVYVHVADSTCSFDIAEIDAPVNSSTGVPIIADGISGVAIAGVDWSINYHSGKLMFDSLTSDFLSDPTLDTVPPLRIVWEDDLNTFTVPDGEAVVTLWFSPNDHVGVTTSLTWVDINEAVDEFGEPIPGISYCDGAVSIVSAPDIFGDVLYCSDPTKVIADATIDLSVTEIRSTITDAGGAYLFANVAPGAYTVCPSKVEPFCPPEGANGVSVADIIKMRRHLAGLNPFESPCQMLAADVNCDDRVSIGDVIKIRRYLACLDPLPCGDWRFVDSRFPMDMDNWATAPNCVDTVMVNSDIEVDFLAVRLGDVNNSWSPSGTPPAAKTSLADVDLTIREGRTTADGLITVPITLTAVSDMAGFELHLEYDGEVLTFQGVTSERLTDVLANAEGGAIHIVWEQYDDPKRIADGETVLTLNFAPIAEFDDATTITPVHAEIVNERGEIMSMSLSEGQISSRDPLVPDRFYLSQNYPNPFNPSTVIAFGLPQTGHVRLTVFNLLGQTVANLIDGDYSAGEHSAEWNGTNNEGRSISSGVYFYRLEAGGFVETKKMLLLK